MIIIRFAVLGFQLFVQLGRYLGGRLLQLLLFFMWPREERRERARRLGARCFAAFFRNLGATFIKLGQILSSRPDLLPKQFITELESLQDHVPAFPARRAHAIIAADLGRPVAELYADLSEEPIAAASIAQVHEGRLPGGERVAVKVQRPSIARTMNRDLSILGFLARVAHILPWLRNLRLPAMADEFARAIRSQLDFRLEVLNNRRFAQNFAELSHVRVADVFDELCGDRVITMRFVEGRKLTEILDDPPIGRSILAERIMDLYYRMVLGDLLVHADMHPGNILVDAEGNYCLLDTGLVYEIPPHYVRKFLRVAAAFATLDGRLVGEAYLEGFDLDGDARSAALDDMEALGERYRNLPFSEIELGSVFLEIMRLLRRHGVYIDAEWACMILSDLTFEGIAKMLDNEVDFMTIGAAKAMQYAPAHGAFGPGDPILAALPGILARRSAAEAAGKGQAATG